MAKKPDPRRASPGAPPVYYAPYTQPMRAVRPVSGTHRRVRAVVAPPMPQPVPGYAVPTQYPQGTRVMPRPVLPRRPQTSDNRWRWALGVAAGMALVVGLGVVALAAGLMIMVSGSRALSGVSSLGVALGGLNEAEATAALQQAWDNRGVILDDQGREFPVQPDLLGLSFDASATARAAIDYGRRSGGLPAMLNGILGGVDIPPSVSVNDSIAREGLDSIAEQVSWPARDAGIRLVNGQVQPRAAENGRQLETNATVAALSADPAGVLADGRLELVMSDVIPAVTDVGALVDAASALLASPLTVRTFDPIDNEAGLWQINPETWSEWLTADADPTAAFGVRLRLNEPALADYLDQQANQLGEGRYLKVDETAAALQTALGQGRTEAEARVYHQDIEHTVQAGETIISIGWDYGVPYPWIQDANPGIGDTLSVGQTITVPSADNFLEYPVVSDKRIVVSISGQHVWVYENGALKWDWVASTGISSSPTWPGIYQVISHEPNAYAGNWDLWMPYFIGVYRPLPNAEFTNGFHGFPTRGGSQLLWTNSLGTRVTYGCILLSDENVRQLYDWAEEGVVVEIQA